MAESDEHKRLVHQLFSYVASTWMMDSESAIFLDAHGHKRPPQLGQYVPDLYARHPKTNMLIIGEAETGKSINGIHAEDQISSFLATCSKERIAVFLLAVPWHMRPYAKALLRNIQARTNHTVRCVVIDELGS